MGGVGSDGRAEEAECVRIGCALSPGSAQQSSPVGRVLDESVLAVLVNAEKPLCTLSPGSCVTTMTAMPLT